MIGVYCIKRMKIREIAMIILLFHQLVSAQITYIPMNTDAALDQMAVGANTESGSTPAQSSMVNGASGYSIPIAVPSGTSGVVPDLTVNYSSNAKSSTFGYGWGLSGISVISRTGQSNYYDGKVTPVNFDATDRFVMDGNRLMLKSGTYGSPGSEYNFEAENFSVVTAYGGTPGNPSYFVMETKEGIKYEYGTFLGQNYLVTPYIKEWYLSRMIYPDGNYITYNYQQVTSVSGTLVNQFSLNEILFTANDAAGISNFASIKFGYDIRDDWNRVFISGVSDDQRILVKDITVKVGSTVFRKYNFKYSLRNGNSYLSEVNESSGSCTLTGTKFKYGDEPVGYKMQHDVQPINTNDNYFPANLNANGITDLLRARRISSNPDHHSYFYGTSDQPFTVNLPPTSTVVGVADCNGDQLGDVLVLKRLGRDTLYDDGTGNPYYNHYDLHEFWVYYNSNPNGVLDYDEQYKLPDIPDTVLVDNAHLSNIYGGDFNGDGLGDYIFINGVNVYISYGQRNVTQPLQPWVLITATQGSFTNINTWHYEVERLYIIDQEGDGKSDIFMVNGTQGVVFGFDTPTHLTELFWQDDASIALEYRLFDQQHFLYPGDFNGDGKTDFLKRTGPDNSSSWYILYNTGYYFASSVFDFPRNPSIEQPVFGVYLGDVVSTGDYNGDGKSDVLLIGSLGGHSFYTDLFLSKGITMDNTLYEEHYNIPYQQSYTGSDYAGIDGKARTIFKLGSGQDPLEIGMSPKSKEHLLVKVKNGELNTTIFDYKLMTEKLGVGDDFYERGLISNATTLISNIQMPVWLAKDFKVQNGNGSHNDYSDINMKIQTAKYANAKIQKSGKGILGFGKQCVEDKWSYLRTLTYNSVNEDFEIILPDSVVTEFVTGANFTKSYTQHQINAVGTNGRYLMTADKMTMYNYYENRTTIQDFITYDAYANPTEVTSSIYTGSPGILVSATNTSTTYGAYGSSIPDKPTSINNTVIRLGTPSYSTQSSFEYNAIGQVTIKKEFVGKPKETTTTYLYWPHGGIKETSIASAGMPAQTSYTEYDTKGRYVVQKKNTNNEIVYSAIYGNAIIAKPTQETNEAGLVSNITYDCFGREYSMVGPTGVTTSHQYLWDGTNGNKKVIVSSSNRPTSTTYLDRLGRQKMTETQGFNGAIITQQIQYDHIGNPAQSTAPYKQGETILTSTTEYGVAYTAQRLRKLMTNVAAFGNTQYDYTYDQGYETISTTAPDGKVTTKKVDASGKTVSSTDSNGKTLDYIYYSHGGLKEVLQGSTTLLTIEYDEYNRKKKQTDLSAGITQYTYDGYGRMETETNAKGQVTSMTYDALNRPNTVTRLEGVTSYEYWPAGSQGKAYKVKKIVGHSGDVHEMDYDAMGRETSSKITIDGQSYETTTQYDGMDRISSRTYPSGLVQHYEYDAYSHLKRVYNGSTNYLIIDEVNGRGQVTKYTLGNGKQSTYTYYHGIPTKYATNDSSYEYNMLWDYKSGNLKRRWDQYGNSDTMEYDILDRLVRWTTQSSTMAMRRDTMHYADNGNILHKTDVGDYTYDNAKIYATKEITNPHSLIKDVEQDITYNSWLQPDTIREGVYTMIYTYSYDGQRIKSVLLQNGQVKETKYYFGEYEKVISNQGTAMVQYIALDGQIKVIIDSQGSTHTPHYVYTDHLGSIVKVTNAAGNDEASQNFDPWGRRRYMGTWTYIDDNAPLGLPIWLYRGYTGHEHLPQFRLINMNGRMYDPELARMLSPDNVIPDGGDTQSYNKYSYVNNNPLRYIDPDGNEFISFLIITAIVSVQINAVSNTLQGKPFYQGAVKAAAFSIVSSVVSLGIGELALLIPNTYLRAGFQAVAHGLYNGISTELQGGKFIHGFATGSISSIGAGLQNAAALKIGTAGKIAVGGIIGGVTSAVVGGDFYRGFTQGAIITAFNHLLHNAGEGGEVSEIIQSEGPGDPVKPTKAVSNSSTVSDLLDWVEYYMSVGEIAKGSELLSLAKSKTPSLFLLNEISIVEQHIRTLAKAGIAVNVISVGFSALRLKYDKSYKWKEFSYDVITTGVSIGVSIKAGAIIGSYFGPGYGTLGGGVVGLGTGVYFNYIKPNFK